MDKILEKLAALGIAAEDMNEVKAAFENAVKANVDKNTDSQAKVLAKRSEEWCKNQIKEATAKIRAEVEEQAKAYCKMIKEEYEKEANEKVQAYAKSLDEASEAWVFQQLEEQFRAKYGEELKATAQNIGYQKVAAQQALQQKRLEFKQEEESARLAAATAAIDNFKKQND